MRLCLTATALAHLFVRPAASAGEHLLGRSNQRGSVERTQPSGTLSHHGGRLCPLQLASSGSQTTLSVKEYQYFPLCVPPPHPFPTMRRPGAHHELSSAGRFIGSSRSAPSSSSLVLLLRSHMCCNWNCFLIHRGQISLPVLGSALLQG